MDNDSDSDVDRGSDGESIEENSLVSEFDDSFASYDDFFEESSVDTYADLYMLMEEKLKRIKDNDPDLEMFMTTGFVNFTDEEWEELGVDISNNTYLREIYFDDTTLNDHNASFLFSGLRGSCSIERIGIGIDYGDREMSEVGVRSMVPFLQNTCNLRALSLSHNIIQSVGFNLLLRALRDSPIEDLYCSNCGIESIEIDQSSIPRKLERLFLGKNSINADGCRELAKLLQGGDSTLAELNLDATKIDNDGVAFLVDALRDNVSLKRPSLWSAYPKKGQMFVLSRERG